MPMKRGYKSTTQTKNIAWFLPRPKKDKYRGGMPLYAEEWLLGLAEEIMGWHGLPTLLNLFCGMNKFGLRVDINPEVEPDIICDAHEVSKILTDGSHPDGKFGIILADPPYSNDESKELYGTGKLNYKKWTGECDKLLVVGGLLIIYHKFIVPNPDPQKYKVIKRVFIGNRTWHTPRVAIYFKKTKD